MSYTKVNYRDADAVGGGLYFLRDELECEQMGFSVIECDPDWTGKAHDHATQNHEEVYFLADGGATITVEGDDVELRPGDAIRVDPDASRQIHNGDEESLFVVAGAP